MIEKFSIKRTNLTQIGFEVEPDPLRLYTEFKGSENGFLLESADRLGEYGRFSLIGINPILELKSTGRMVEISSEFGTDTKEDNPFDVIQNILGSVIKEDTDLPFAYGGLAGWIGYDAVRHIEKVIDTNEGTGEVHDIHLMLPKHLIIIDREIKVVHALTFTFSEDKKECSSSHSQSHEQIHSRLVNFLKQCEQAGHKPTNEAGLVAEPHTQTPEELAKEWSSPTSFETFIKGVHAAKEHIKKGDAFQLVFSRRLTKKTEITPVDLYRQLRRLNPSPYMFMISTSEADVVGASPETMVHMKNQTAVVHPIAGTKPRGKTQEEDQKNETDLLGDIKENAEHLMLVDLARNDIGRISEYGSVDVPKFRTIERFSHVMHIVSEVTGKVKSDLDTIDVFKACFPAGTVSGAPKIKAMSLIDENEPVRRGIYAGAVGWFGTNNEMDTCIAIRTAVMKGNEVHVQAGGGLVQDSQPKMEFMETLHKSASIMRAVQLAELEKKEGSRHDSSHR